jgi:hypothetical protein
MLDNGPKGPEHVADSLLTARGFYHKIKYILLDLISVICTSFELDLSWQPRVGNNAVNSTMNPYFSITNCDTPWIGNRGMNKVSKKFCARLVKF